MAAYYSRGPTREASGFNLHAFVKAHARAAVEKSPMADDSRATISASAAGSEAGAPLLLAAGDGGAGLSHRGC
jgi:hypothetical protein